MAADEMAADEAVFSTLDSRKYRANQQAPILPKHPRNLPLPISPTHSRNQQMQPAK